MESTTLKKNSQAAQALPASSAAVTNAGRDVAEIDLLKLLQSFLARWYIIVMWGLIGVLLANALAYFRITPKYESTAKLYIVSTSGDSVVDLTDLNIGTSLTNDYKVLILSYPVLDQVISSLNLDMTSDGLANLITLDNPDNTRVLSITAKTEDAELSASIVNTLAAVAQSYLPETMGTVKPNVAQVGRVATVKSEPSYLKFMLIGGFLAALLVMGIMTVQFIQDDTVKTPDDLESLIGITVLASIPDTKELNYGDNEHKKKHKHSLHSPLQKSRKGTSK